MRKDYSAYLSLARALVDEHLKEQNITLYANMTKMKTEELDVSQKKILNQIRLKLDSYQNSDGTDMSEKDKDTIIQFVSREMWGYADIDDLICDPDVSDIKMYSENNIRIKKLGERTDSGIVFENQKVWKDFLIRILERNKINLGTANAIQTFTDHSQEKFILRITIISELLVDGGNPLIAIRKIPKKKDSLDDLKKKKMFARVRRKPVQEMKMPAYSSADLFSKLLFKMINSKGIIFTGKGAAGKTTFMNAMIKEIPHDEAVMICQENPELFDLEHPDLFTCHVMTNAGDSKISYSLGDLTRSALLLDLDRVIVGEVKNGEEAAGLWLNKKGCHSLS